MPLCIHSRLLHNEQHLVLIYPQKPKQPQKEEELAAEEIHRMAGCERMRATKGGLFLTLGTVGEWNVSPFSHPTPSVALVETSPHLLKQHAVSILGQTYTISGDEERGGEARGCWYLGGKRHRKESATQRQAAVITVELCNKTKRENKEGADVGGVWSQEFERDLPHFVNSLFVTFSFFFAFFVLTQQAYPAT